MPHVLLVGDGMPTPSSVEAELAGAGFEVTRAADCLVALAIALARGDRFDLLLIYVALRQLDCCALAEILRARRPGLPVGAVTDRSPGRGGQAVARLKALGAIVIERPTLPVHVVAAIRAALGLLGS